MKTAILGWGSLLWDTRVEFDATHGPWEPHGPSLPIEFSRISATRGGALTLVVDHQFGTWCSSAFSVSNRTCPDDAIADLSLREGTTLKNIGFYFANGSRRQSCAAETLKAVEKWDRLRDFDVVVWTDLKSNFAAKSKLKQSFSVVNAFAHLQLLPADVKAKAADYISRAPSFVDTPLRRAIKTEPWFETLAKQTITEGKHA